MKQRAIYNYTQIKITVFQLQYTEAVARGCSIKNIFFKILPIQRKTPVSE